MLYKMTAKGGMTAIGYRPATGCNIYIPSFEQCKQTRATLARRSLCGTAWCCSRKAGDWCFPRQETMQQKKKETRKRGRKTISFRADCKFRGRKSQRFLNQKSSLFVLRKKGSKTKERMKEEDIENLKAIAGGQPEKKSSSKRSQKVFVLSSAPFSSMLRRRRAPSWDLSCVCTLTNSACEGDTSTFLAVKNRLEKGTLG